MRKFAFTAYTTADKNYTERLNYKGGSEYGEKVMIPQHPSVKVYLRYDEWVDYITFIKPKGLEEEKLLLPLKGSGLNFNAHKAKRSQGSM